MAQSQTVTLQAHTRVTAINTASQTVHTSAGDFGYAKLVLATGAQPIRIPLAGDAAGAVLSVNSWQDFSAFHARLTGANLAANTAACQKHIVIMGAGLIGCEFANDLVSAGFAVSVVDPASSPIAALLPTGLGEQLREALASQGVVWHFGTTVQRVDHRTGSGGALSVQLANGQTLVADVVLSAIGLRADLGPAAWRKPPGCSASAALWWMPSCKPAHPMSMRWVTPPNMRMAARCPMSCPSCTPPRRWRPP
jgi:rubredoxin---NAD+ reductase